MFTTLFMLGLAAAAVIVQKIVLVQEEERTLYNGMWFAEFMASHYSERAEIWTEEALWASSILQATDDTVAK